jgi:hypothetical protein
MPTCHTLLPLCRLSCLVANVSTAMPYCQYANIMHVVASFYKALLISQVLFAV